jgi:hypothetical protein
VQRTATTLRTANRRRGAWFSLFVHRLSTGCGPYQARERSTPTWLERPVERCFSVGCPTVSKDHVWREALAAMPPRLLDREQHFCGMKCLDQWIINRG